MPPFLGEPPDPSWRRDASELHGDWIVRTGKGFAHAHVEVELRPFGALVQRGVLIVLLDLAIVYLLWLASVIALCTGESPGLASLTDVLQAPQFDRLGIAPIAPVLAP